MLSRFLPTLFAQLIVCIFLIDASYSFVSISSFESVNHALSKATRSNVGDFGVRQQNLPVIQINENLGQLQSSISIPLPPHLLSLKELRLDYHSHNLLNLGLGKGMTLDLPQIWHSNHSIESRRLKLFYAGTQHELIETKEEEADFEKLKTRILPNITSTLGVIPGQVSLVAYRPLLDERFLLILAIFEQSNLKGYVLIDPALGERWIFSEKGELSSLVDDFGNNIQFSWNANGLLRTIKSGWPLRVQGGWQVDFSYLHAQAWEKWWRGMFRKFPKGLKKISYQFFGADQRILQFVYQDEQYLSRIFWQGEDLKENHLFHGEYKKIANEKRKIRHLPRLSEGELYHFGDLSERPEVVESKVDTANQSELIFYVDLTGNGLSDRLILDLRKLEDAKRQLDESLDYIATSRANVYRATISREEYLKSFRERMPDLEVEFANLLPGDHDESSRIKYQRQSHLSIPYHLFPLFTFRIKEGGGFERNNKFYRSFGVQPEEKVFHLADVTGNGRSELVSCGEKTNLSEESFLKALAGERKNPGSKSAYFAERGRVATILSLVVDEKRVQDTFNTLTAFDSTEDVNDLVNEHPLSLFKWERQEAPFTCHQHSLFFDFNQDGQVDVLTGARLFLLSGTKEVKIIDWNEQNRSNHFVLPKNIEGQNYSQIFVNQKGKLEFSLFEQQLIHPKTREIYQIKDGTALVSRFRGTERVLSSLKTNSGGVARFHYKWQDGVYTLVQKVKNTADERSMIYQIDYSYLSPSRDLLTGAFWGFSRVQLESQYLQQESVAARREEKVYYRDAHPLVAIYHSRARLNGRLKEWHVFDRDSNNHLKSQQFMLDGIDLGKGRIHPYNPREVTSNLRLNDGMALTQETYSLEFKKWKKTRDNHKLIPLARLEKLTSYRPQVTSGPGPLTVTSVFYEKIFLPHLYRLQMEKRMARDLLNNSARVETFQINQRGLVEAIYSGEKSPKIERFFYDDLGRLTRKIFPTQLETEFYYDKTSPLAHYFTQIIDKENRSELEILARDALTGAITRLKSPQGVFRFDHSLRGELLQVSEEGEAIIFKLLSTDQNQRSFQWRDQIFTVTEDGWGELVSSEKEFAGYSLKSGPLLRAGSLLLQKSGESSPDLEPSRSMNFWRYDALGRLIRFQQGQPRGHVFNFNHEGACTSKRMESIIYTRECFDAYSNLVEQSFRGESVRFRRDAFGGITQVQPFGAHFQFDEHGKLTSSRLELPSTSDRRDRGVTPWRLFTINHKIDDGASHQTTYASYTFDRLKRLVEFRPNNLSGESGDFTKIQRRHHSRGVEREDFYQGDVPVLSFDYEYNDRSLLSGFIFKNFRFDFEYDQFRRISRELIQGPGTVLEERHYQYHQGALVSLSPWIDNIVYRATKQISAIEYANGLRLSLDYNEQDQLESMAMKSPYQSNLWMYRTLLEPDGRLRRESLHHAGDISFNKRYHYDENLLPLVDDPTEVAERDHFGRVRKINERYFSWRGGHLVSTDDGIEHYYTPRGTLLASCPQGVSVRETEKCFYRLSNTEVVFLGILSRLVLVEGLPVGAVVQDRFYPLAVDARGSVRAILNPEGTHLLIERHYSDWGEEEVVFHTEGWGAQVPTDRKKAFLELINRAIPWSYAGLIRNPLYTDRSKDLYWSETRVYSAKLQEWLSVDPLLLRHPNRLLLSPGNWAPTRYAINDPINFIDPSGEAAHLGWAMAGGGIVGGITGGISAYRNGTDIYKGAGVGAISGAGTAFGYAAGGPLMFTRALMSSNFAFTGSLLGQGFINHEVQMNHAVQAAISAQLSASFNHFVRDLDYLTGLFVDQILHSVEWGSESGETFFSGERSFSDFNGEANSRGIPVREPNREMISRTEIGYRTWDPRTGAWIPMPSSPSGGGGSGLDDLLRQMK